MNTGATQLAIKAMMLVAEAESLLKSKESWMGPAVLDRQSAQAIENMESIVHDALLKMSMVVAEGQKR